MQEFQIIMYYKNHLAFAKNSSPFPCLSHSISICFQQDIQMYSLKVFFFIAILAICQAVSCCYYDCCLICLIFCVELLSYLVQDVHIELFDNSNIIRETVESSWYCRAASFNQYLASVLTDVPFPKDCVAPGLSIFSPVDVIFIEETISFNSSILFGFFILQTLFLKENLTLLKLRVLWNLLVYSTNVAMEFNVFVIMKMLILVLLISKLFMYFYLFYFIMQNLSSLDLGNKTVIYRPLHLAVYFDF